MIQDPIHQEKNLYPGSSVKVPKWLKGPVPKGRGELEIDSIDDGEATALNIVGGSGRIYQNYRKTRKRLKEMEELKEWGQKKAEKSPEKIDGFLDGMDQALNSMVG